MEEGHKLRSGLTQCEVKLEPPEDIKDISTTINFFNSAAPDPLDVLSSNSSSSNLWAYLIKTVR